MDKPITIRDLLIRLKSYQVSMGYDPDKMSLAERMATMRDYHTALAVEQAELLQELPWKPWRPLEDQPSMRSLDRTVDEWTDCLVFLIDQAIILGITPDRVEDSIVDVLHKILSRVDSGYNVKKEKRKTL